jgi:hypothetical protein
VEKFLSRYRSLVTGTLSGFDRIVFRGILQPLMRQFGMYYMLKDAGIQLLEFKRFALDTTERVKKASLAEAVGMKRPILYLESATVDKQALARRVLADHPIDEGLICVFKALEPCTTFEYQRSADREERGLRLVPGKCLHLYHYWLHPRFGFMNARIQTWFPFTIQICLNGREWLARQLLGKGQNFRRADNCFTWLGDPSVAQHLMDEQLTTAWPAALSSIARSLNPCHETIFRASPIDYYWTAYQTEWATDLLFRDPQSLSTLYPQLVRYAMNAFQSPDVMRFLAQKAPGNFTGEIVSSFKDRAEGVRVKHWLRGNSIKMYDKAGSVLRVETTIGDPTDFKVFRTRQNDPDGTPEWLPLRKGVADLHRRAQVSQRSNNTYLNALAAVGDSSPCSRLFDTVSRPVTDGGRRVRALRLADPDDIALLQAIARGEFAISGFRNADIRRQLYPAAANLHPLEQRPLSAKVTRLLRLLRAHGLIQKIQKTSRYRLTSHGQLLTAALFATRNADITQLLSKAA